MAIHRGLFCWFVVFFLIDNIVALKVPILYARQIDVEVTALKST